MMKNFLNKCLISVFTPDYSLFFVWFMITAVALARDFGEWVWLAAIPAVAIEIIAQRRIELKNIKDKKNETTD